MQGVLPGSAAEKAGLLATRRGLTGVIAGDVIVGVDGKKINTAPDLTNILDEKTIGDSVTLDIIRSGEGGASQKIQVSVTLQGE